MQASQTTTVRCVKHGHEGLTPVSWSQSNTTAMSCLLLYVPTPDNIMALPAVTLASIQAVVVSCTYLRTAAYKNQSFESGCHLSAQGTKAMTWGQVLPHQALLCAQLICNTSQWTQWAMPDTMSGILALFGDYNGHKASQLHQHDYGFRTLTWPGAEPTLGYLSSGVSCKCP